MALQVVPPEAVERCVQPVAAAVRAALGQCNAEDPAMIAVDAWMAGVSIKYESRATGLSEVARTGPNKLATCLSKALSGPALKALPAGVKGLTVMMRAAKPKQGAASAP